MNITPKTKSRKIRLFSQRIAQLEYFNKNNLDKLCKDNSYFIGGFKVNLTPGSIKNNEVDSLKNTLIEFVN